MGVSLLATCDLNPRTTNIAGKAKRVAERKAWKQTTTPHSGAATTQLVSTACPIFDQKQVDAIVAASIARVLEASTVNNTGAPYTVRALVGTIPSSAACHNLIDITRWKYSLVMSLSTIEVEAGVAAVATAMYRRSNWNEEQYPRGYRPGGHA